MACRLSSRQSLTWLLCVLSRQFFTVQSCSLSRLPRAATAFGLCALLFYCRCHVSSPSLLPSAFQRHLPLIRTPVQPFDVPRVITKPFFSEFLAHFCVVDKAEDVCSGFVTEQDLQVCFVSSFADRDFSRA
jgi:hypothetical protein